MGQSAVISALGLAYTQMFWSPVVLLALLGIMAASFICSLPRPLLRSSFSSKTSVLRRSKLSVSYDGKVVTFAIEISVKGRHHYLHAVCLVIVTVSVFHYRVKALEQII